MKTIRILLIITITTLSTSIYAADQSFKITRIGAINNDTATVWIDSVFDCEGTNTTTLEIKLGNSSYDAHFTNYTLLLDAARNSRVVHFIDIGDTSVLQWNNNRAACVVDSENIPSVLMVAYP